MEDGKMIYSVLEVELTFGLVSQSDKYSFEQCGIAEILDFLVDNRFPTDHEHFSDDYELLKAMVNRGVSLNHFIIAYQVVSRKIDLQKEVVKLSLVVDEVERLMGRVANA